MLRRKSAAKINPSSNSWTRVFSPQAKPRDSKVDDGLNDDEFEKPSDIGDAFGREPQCDTTRALRRQVRSASRRLHTLQPELRARLFAHSDMCGSES